MKIMFLIFGLTGFRLFAWDMPYSRLPLKKIRRVLRPGGIFFFNVYSDEHTSARSGDCLEDGRIANILSGTLVGVGSLGLNSKSQMTFCLQMAGRS